MGAIILEQSIPYEIENQLIQCYRHCFYYKDDVEKFMVNCGVSNELALKYKDEYKVVNAKNVILELNNYANKNKIIKNMITNFYYMEKLPDNLTDEKKANEMLKELKRLVNKFNMIKQPSKTNEYHIYQQDKKMETTLIYKENLSKLKNKYYYQFSNSNPQNRGFELEKIIEELFKINGMKYKKSYRNETNTQQIDGYFELDGFSYLIEAKWTKDKINSDNISNFKHKVDSKLDATRGLFISINGYREEVLREYSSNSFNIIFIDGQELMHIFEERITLEKLIKFKIESASSLGNPNADIVNLLI